MNKFYTIKVKLNPTPGQFILMYSWGEYSRDFYDHALSYLKRCYYEAKNNQSVSVLPLEILSVDELIAEFRNNQVTSCVYDICPHSICDGAIRKAYHDVHFFEEEKYLFMPKCSYHRKGLGKIKVSFFIYPRDICFSDNKIFINKLGKVKLAEKDRIQAGFRFKNPWFVFDGSDWYITVKVPIKDSNFASAVRGNVKPCINITDTAFIKLEIAYERLEGFVEAYTRKTPMSKNWSKALKRLRGHAGLPAFCYTICTYR